MAAPEASIAGSDDALVVRTHVTPWGFVVALPFAVAFALLGAISLDAGLVPQQVERLDEAPIWLFGALLIGFGLFLALVGVGELASYMKPAVEVVLDQNGIAAFGMLGERRMAWADIVEARIESGYLALRARAGGARTMRLHFNRLGVDPVALLSRIERHRPDLRFHHMAAGA